MLLLIFLALAAYGVYELFGAIALFWSVLPFVLCLPFLAILDLGNWLRYRKRDARNKRRRELWNNHVDMTIDRLSEELDDRSSYDENGTPYEIP